MSNATKKQLATATTALLGVFAFQPTAAAEQKFQKLTGAQIQAKFPGMELTDEAHWGEIFERNGTLTITSMGHKSAGKWRIQKDQLLSRNRKRTGWRLLPGVAVRKKRGAEKSDLKYSLGGRASKASPGQMIGRGLLRCVQGRIQRSGGCASQGLRFLPLQRWQQRPPPKRNSKNLRVGKSAANLVAWN